MTGFDYSELDDLRDMFRILSDQFPKETNKFLKKAGQEQAKWIRKGYRLKTKKKTGNLIKGVKPGKPFIYGEDNRQLRVYSSAHHAHLIEFGHKQGAQGKYVPSMDKRPKNSFVRGRRIVETERKAFESEFYKMADEWIDKFLEVMK